MLSDVQRQRMADRQSRRAEYLRLRSAGFEPATEGFEPVRSGRRALHSLLVIFPAVAFLLAVALDVVYLLSGVGVWASWSSGFLFVGLLASLPATAVGVVDWTRVPTGTRARSIATWHGVISVVALSLFAAGWVSRIATSSAPPLESIVLVWSGAAILMLGGVLGGELATRLGVQPLEADFEDAEPARAGVTVIAPVEPVDEDRQIAQA